MSRLARSRHVLAVLAVAATLSGAATAGALAQHDTSAVAVNTKDGSSVFKLAFSIIRASGDTVDQQNTALAYASCNACQTVAISIQVLLVVSDPVTFAPVNQAIAINQDCSQCDTLASAYQFAIGVGDKLKLTADGRRQVADIRRQLHDLRDAGLTGPEIQAQLDVLMGQLGDVLRTDVVGMQEPAGAAPPSTDTTPTSTETTPTTTETAPANTDTTPTDTNTTPTSTDTTPTTTETTPTTTETTPTTTETTPTDTGTTDTTAAPPPSG